MPTRTRLRTSLSVKTLFGRDVTVSLSRGTGGSAANFELDELPRTRELLFFYDTERAAAMVDEVRLERNPTDEESVIGELQQWLNGRQPFTVVQSVGMYMQRFHLRMGAWRGYPIEPDADVRVPVVMSRQGTWTAVTPVSMAEDFPIIFDEATAQRVADFVNEYLAHFRPDASGVSPANQQREKQKRSKLGERVEVFRGQYTSFESNEPVEYVVYAFPASGTDQLEFVIGNRAPIFANGAAVAQALQMRPAYYSNLEIPGVGLFMRLEDVTTMLRNVHALQQQRYGQQGAPAFSTVVRVRYGWNPDYVEKYRAEYDGKAKDGYARVKLTALRDRFKGDGRPPATLWLRASDGFTKLWTKATGDAELTDTAMLEPSEAEKLLVMLDARYQQGLSGLGAVSNVLDVEQEVLGQPGILHFMAGVIPGNITIYGMRPDTDYRWYITTLSREWMQKAMKAGYIDYSSDLSSDIRIPLAPSTVEKLSVWLDQHLEEGNLRGVTETAPSSSGVPGLILTGVEVLRLSQPRWNGDAVPPPKPLGTGQLALELGRPVWIRWVDGRWEQHDHPLARVTWRLSMDDTTKSDGWVQASGGDFKHVKGTLQWLAAGSWVNFGSYQIRVTSEQDKQAIAVFLEAGDLKGLGATPYQLVKKDMRAWKMRVVLFVDRAQGFQPLYESRVVPPGTEGAHLDRDGLYRVMGTIVPQGPFRRGVQGEPRDMEHFNMLMCRDPESVDDVEDLWGVIRERAKAGEPLLIRVRSYDKYDSFLNDEDYFFFRGKMTRFQWWAEQQSPTGPLLAAWWKEYDSNPEFRDLIEKKDWWNPGFDVSLDRIFESVTLPSEESWKPFSGIAKYAGKTYYEWDFPRERWNHETMQMDKYVQRVRQRFIAELGCGLFLVENTKKSRKDFVGRYQIIARNGTRLLAGDDPELMQDYAVFVLSVPELCEVTSTTAEDEEQDKTQKRWMKAYHGLHADLQMQLREHLEAVQNALKTEEE